MFYKFLLSGLLIFSFVLFSCEQQDPVAPVQESVLAPVDCIQGKGFPGKHGWHGDLTVMTRNIYVGTNVDIVLGATTPEEVIALATQAFQTFLSTNFPARAELLANEIEATEPDLIGLQEVYLYRIQSPGDLVVGGTEPATDVFVDFLDILLDALAFRGLDYKVAGKIQNTDVEVPVIFGVNSDGSYLINDMRVTDFDVTLVKKNVKIDRVKTGNYNTRFDIPSLNSSVLRGYVIVDAKIGQDKFRFVNTHLEDPSFVPELEQVQIGQAVELTALLKGQSHPQIVVGDFNSPYVYGATRPTYDLMIGSGYTDAWLEDLDQPNPLGYTYGHALDLRDEVPQFYQRIDYIFLKNKAHCTDIGPVNAWVIGDDEFANRWLDDDGKYVWPSDHAGVVAELDIPKWNKRIAAK